jgi:uncharacterized protein YbjT (DUF2867 family)
LPAFFFAPTKRFRNAIWINWIQTQTLKEEPQMILVVGSTGMLGGEICRRLTSRGKAVRGLVRATSNPERMAALKAWGVETVLGDLRDLVSLAKACQGVETVITTATTTSSMQLGDSIAVTDQQGQLSLVRAARSQEVQQFIYISCSKNFDAGLTPCPSTVAKRTVEQAVMSSGMACTILRPCDYMEVWLSPAEGFDYANAKATVYGEGHARISYISIGDVAQCAVESINNEAARNQIIELGGPAAVSPLEAVRIFEKISGKPFELQFVPAAALMAQKEAATDFLQKSLASLMLSNANGLEADTSLERRLFSFTLTSVEDYARRALGVEAAMPTGLPDTER